MSDRVERKDIRVLVTAVAQFAAGIEAHLRQIEPALTLSQLVALERVVQHPRLRPFQLASQMKISRQLAWQTCKRLESLGLLSMSNVDSGKRVVEAEATAAGAAHLRRVLVLHAAIAEALQAAGETLDVAALRSGLQRLTAAVARIDAADKPEAARQPGAARAEGRRGGGGPRMRADADMAPHRRPRAADADAGGQPRERGSGK